MYFYLCTPFSLGSQGYTHTLFVRIWRKRGVLTVGCRIASHRSQPIVSRPRKPIVHCVPAPQSPKDLIIAPADSCSTSPFPCSYSSLCWLIFYSEGDRCLKQMSLSYWMGSVHITWPGMVPCWCHHAEMSHALAWFLLGEMVSDHSADLPQALQQPHSDTPLPPAPQTSLQELMTSSCQALEPPDVHSRFPCCCLSELPLWTMCPAQAFALAVLGTDALAAWAGASLWGSALSSAALCLSGGGWSQWDWVSPCSPGLPSSVALQVWGPGIHLWSTKNDKGEGHGGAPGQASEQLLPSLPSHVQRCRSRWGAASIFLRAFTLNVLFSAELSSLSDFSSFKSLQPSTWHNLVWQCQI